MDTNGAAANNTECAGAIILIDQTHLLYKTTAADKRPDTDAVWAAIVHIIGCAVCKRSFSAQICKQNVMANWMGTKPDNQRSTWHYFLHRFLDIPCCVTDAAMVAQFETNLRAAYREERSAKLLAAQKKINHA